VLQSGCERQVRRLWKITYWAAWDGIHGSASGAGLDGKAVARLETSANPFEAFPAWYLLELRERLKRRIAERALGKGDDVQTLGITDQRTL
jgi:hypothetical protein